MTKKIKIIIAVVSVVVIMLVGVFSFFAYNGFKAKGQFYTLQEAYDNGFINQDDLKNIAYYHNNEITPEGLSNKTERAIKRSCGWKYRLDKVEIISYSGTYNDCVAVMITKATAMYNTYGPEIKIETVEFRYTNSNRIKIWKENTK